MSKEFIKGVLDAKLSELLTESDFTAFSNLNDADKLTFFINHNLVSTNIVSNFEAMCAYVLSDLKGEISEFIGSSHYYLEYFFGQSSAKEDTYATALRYNKIYTLALAKNDEWFVRYLDLEHAILNLLTILRATTLGKASAEIKSYYLVQSLISEEVYASLINNERSSVLAYIKTIFNLDIEGRATNREIEDQLDEYLNQKLKEFAYETELEPTIIYYIKMKIDEVIKLRAIYYTKEALHG